MARYEMLRCDYCGKEAEINDSTGWLFVETETNGDDALLVIEHFCSKECLVQEKGWQADFSERLSFNEAHALWADLCALTLEGRAEEIKARFIERIRGLDQLVVFSQYSISFASGLFKATAKRLQGLDEATAVAFCTSFLHRIAWTQAESELGVSPESIDWDELLREVTEREEPREEGPESP
jgi:hypothetical protein